MDETGQFESPIRRLDFSFNPREWKLFFRFRGRLVRYIFIKFSFISDTWQSNHIFLQLQWMFKRRAKLRWMMTSRKFLHDWVPTISISWDEKEIEARWQKERYLRNLTRRWHEFVKNFHILVPRYENDSSVATKCIVFSRNSCTWCEFLLRAYYDCSRYEKKENNFSISEIILCMWKRFCIFVFLTASFSWLWHTW